MSISMRSLALSLTAKPQRTASDSVFVHFLLDIFTPSCPQGAGNGNAKTPPGVSAMGRLSREGAGSLSFYNRAEALFLQFQIMFEV